MFEFKLSFSSFRLCRPKRTSPAATTHCFSPFNPKTLEIAYPITPSPPPTTPNFQPQLSNSKTPNSDHRKITKKKKQQQEKKPISRSSEESGWFSNTSTDGETESSTVISGSFDSSNKKQVEINGGGGLRMMRESLTVVKWSEKPYEDFKKSMLEMILEKEMMEGKDLEQLLQCFLSLNSRHHHADIVAAFTEIWELLFL